MAKNTFLDWDTTASNNTDVGGIGILGTNPVSNFDDALRTIMAQLRAGVDGEVVYATKGSNYSSVANDNNAFHRFTATATVTLVAAATLGAGWHYAVSAVGASTIVTIDPNGSETIGGVTTLIIRGGQTAFIVCDGTNFQVEIRGKAYATQSGGYTALVGDKNTAQRFTASATLALTAAATLGSSWTLDVIADGGAVTIDPNGSETINGQTTLSVPNGSSCTIICDGSNFFTVIKPFAWEIIGDFSASTATSIDVTNLGAFRKLRVSGSIQPSALAALTLRTSSNNGSSYDAGASDYSYQAQNSSGTTVQTAAATSTLIALSSSGGVDASTPYVFEVIIDDFNKAAIMRVLGRGFGTQTSTIQLYSVGGQRSQATARNAIRLLMNSGTITGNVTVEGMRG